MPGLGAGVLPAAGALGARRRRSVDAGGAGGGAAARRGAGRDSARRSRRRRWGATCSSWRPIRPRAAPGTASPAGRSSSSGSRSSAEQACTRRPCESRRRTWSSRSSFAPSKASPRPPACARPRTERPLGGPLRPPREPPQRRARRPPRPRGLTSSRPHRPSPETTPLGSDAGVAERPRPRDSTDVAERSARSGTCPGLTPDSGVADGRGGVRWGRRTSAHGATTPKRVLKPRTPSRVRKTKRAKTKKTKARGHQHPELVGLVLAAFGIFLATVLWAGWNGGYVGGWIGDGLEALIGGAAFALPIVLVVVGCLMVGRSDLVDVRPVPHRARRARHRPPPDARQRGRLPRHDARRRARPGARRHRRRDRRRPLR